VNTERNFLYSLRHENRRNEVWGKDDRRNQGADREETEPDAAVAGSLKEMSCWVALHEKGEIVLPEARVVDFTRKMPTVGPEEVVPESDPVEGLLPMVAT